MGNARSARSAGNWRDEVEAPTIAHLSFGLSSDGSKDGRQAGGRGRRGWATRPRCKARRSLAPGPLVAFAARPIGYRARLGTLANDRPVLLKVFTTVLDGGARSPFLPCTDLMSPANTVLRQPSMLGFIQATAASGYVARAGVSGEWRSEAKTERPADWPGSGGGSAATCPATPAVRSGRRKKPASRQIKDRPRMRPATCLNSPAPPRNLRASRTVFGLGRWGSR